MFLRFLTGMSLTGYLITGLVVALMASTAMNVFQGRRIENLHEDIGAYETTVDNLAAANLDTRESLSKVEELLKQCIGKRKDAEAIANRAREILAQKQKEAYIASDKRRDTVEDSIKQQNAECLPSTLPSRATELLIEAARSANRGADSP